MMRNLATFVPIAEPLVRFARAHRDEPVLTAFITGGMADPADRRHWQVVLKRGLSQRRRALTARPRAERDAFDAAVEHLTRALPPDATVHAAPGFAAFATATGDVLIHRLDGGPDPAVTWSRGPRLAPCVVANALPPAIVAIADRQHATLLRLERGAITELERIAVEPVVEPGMHMGNAPRRGFHTGTRGEAQRDAAARKLREASERHAAHVAARIAAFAGGGMHVVVGGVEDTVQRIIDALPRGLHTRLAHGPALRAGAAEPGLIAGAEQALRDAEDVRQAGLARELIDAACAGGHAAVGLPDALRALERRAVDVLVVSPRLLAREDDALEEMVREALDERAIVEVALPTAARVLDATADGVAARLRFAVPTTRRARPRQGPRRKTARAGT